MNEFFKLNQELWNARTVEHLEGKFYKHEEFRKEKNALTEIEDEALGDVSGKSLLHLQCHFGQDTLSWAHKGAQVTGIDFSSKAIEAAQKLSTDLKIPARFIEANVYDVPEKINEKFDIVFTSYGAICWLDDIDRWAKVVADMLKPGGIFYLVEFHPAIYIHDFDTGEIMYSYFQGKEPIADESVGTYGSEPSTIEYTDYTWIHGIAKTTQALLDQGIELLEQKEYPFSPYNCFPEMREVGPDRFVMKYLPKGYPHTFSLKMKKKTI